MTQAIDGINLGVWKYSFGAMARMVGNGLLSHHTGRPGVAEEDQTREIFGFGEYFAIP